MITQSVLYPTNDYGPGCTPIHFGRNQLLPDSIGFSPLTPGHPKGLDHNRLRASTALSHGFTLPRARSSGFGSYPTDSTRFRTRFRYAFLLASEINSLPRFSKRTAGSSRLAACLNRLTVTTWFQALFSTCYGCFSVFPHSTTALSDSRYCLGLDQDETQLLTPHSRSHTRDPWYPPSDVLLPGFHRVSRCFPAHFGLAGEA